MFRCRYYGALTEASDSDDLGDSGVSFPSGKGIEVEVRANWSATDDNTIGAIFEWGSIINYITDMMEFESVWEQLKNLFRGFGGVGRENNRTFCNILAKGAVIPR